MGEIWRAVDTSTGRVVAVKRIRRFDDGPLPAAYRNRLIREARALAGLSHPHIVEYLGFGFDEQDQPYLVMELLEGESLSARLQHTPLSIAEVVTLVSQVLRGLEGCHEQGVIHRDIKPGNLFLLAGGGGMHVKLLDFGLALLGGDATRLTRAGEIFGTLHYMSPEQAKSSDQVDQRTDVYAVGVLIYELLTGQLPFTGDQPAALLLKILTETPVMPRKIRPGLPHSLEQIITRAMARNPSARYSTAGEMSAALGSRAVQNALERMEEIALDRTVAAPADALSDTVSSLSSSSLEVRLVCLLCVRPVSRDEQIAAVVTRAVEDAGGVFHHLYSGELIGLFGVERMHGDEALRAVQAGMKVREEAHVMARSLVATLHVEVGEGLKFPATELDRIIEPLGSLPPGQLVLNPRVNQLLGGLVEVRRQGAHRIVRRTTGGISMRRRVLGVETPTVGREAELAALRATFSRATGSREPEAVLILGPAGIGKSRLFHELVGEVRKGSVLCLESRADSTQSKHPYSLLADALGRCIGIHVGQDDALQRASLRTFVGRFVQDPQAHEVCSFLGEAMGIAAEDQDAMQVARCDPKVWKERMTQALQALLDGAGRDGPVSLCVEDLHWADEESLNLCETLLERVAGFPFFLMATARPELVERRPRIFEEVGAARIEVRPLIPRFLRSLLRAMLGGEVGPQIEDLIIERSNGNPYFVEELVSWLVSRGQLVRGPVGWMLEDESPSSLELPLGVEGAIQGRLDLLPAAQKDLLKAASVFGETFWETGCEALGFPGAGALLRDLETAGFVSRRRQSRMEGTCEWLFRHALLHQVAYRMLPEDVCGSHHLRAGRWLERVGWYDPALLASHFQQGKDAAKAAEYHALAGQGALEEGDLERSVEAFLSSLVDDLEPEMWADRALGLSRAYILLGRQDQAWQLLESLDAREGALEDAHRLAECLFLRGRVLLARGQFEDAEGVLNRTLDLLRDSEETDLQFDIGNTLFWSLWSQGRYSDAGRTGEAMREHAVRGERPDRLCSAKLVLAYFNVVEGDLSLSVSLAREAAEHAREARHPYLEVDALIMLGSAMEIVGLYDRAEETLVVARDLALQLKTGHQQASVETCLGRVALNLNRPSPAVDHFRRSVDKSEELGDSRNLCIALSGEAMALCERAEPGDLERGAAAAGRALELSTGQSGPLELEARLALAKIAIARREVQDAVEHATVALDLFDRLGTHERCVTDLLLAAREAFSEAGMAEDAVAMVQRAREVLAERASRIADLDTRRSFTEAVPHHRAIMDL